MKVGHCRRPVNLNPRLIMTDTLSLVNHGLPPAEVAELNVWIDWGNHAWADKMDAHRKNGTRPCYNCNTTLPANRTYCPACGMKQDKEVV